MSLLTHTRLRASEFTNFSVFSGYLYHDIGVELANADADAVRTFAGTGEYADAVVQIDAAVLSGRFWDNGVLLGEVRSYTFF